MAVTGIMQLYYKAKCRASSNPCLMCWPHLVSVFSVFVPVTVLGDRKEGYIQACTYKGRISLQMHIFGLEGVISLLLGLPSMGVN